jgi:hypothetical protein
MSGVAGQWLYGPTAQEGFSSLPGDGAGGAVDQEFTAPTGAETRSRFFGVEAPAPRTLRPTPQDGYVLWCRHSQERSKENPLRETESWWPAARLGGDPQCRSV